MKIINIKMLSLLLLISSLACVPIYAEPAPAESESANTEQAEARAEVLAETKTLLADIKQHSLQAKELKENFANVPDIDLLLFIQLIGASETELRNGLDSLIVLQQGMDQSTPESQKLLKQVQTIAIEQSQVLQKEKLKLDSIINRLRTQDTQDRTIKFTIERTQQTMYQLLAAWEKNIQRKKLLNLDVTDDSKQLIRAVQFIAISQTGHIRLDIDTLNDLNNRLSNATLDEETELNKQIKEIEWQKDIAAQNLEKMVEIMNGLDVDTTKFGAALVVATGEILNQNVEAKVIISLFKRVIDSSLSWLQENLPLIIFKLVSFILIILIFKLLAAIARKIVDKATASSKFDSSQLLKDFLSSIAHKLVMIVGFMIALSQLGIEIGPLLAGMGIMGFVIGFALQDTLSNFASGLMILVYRPFDIGDLVDVATTFGEVKQMNLVSTTILTIDNKRLIIPNSKIWGDIITNVSAERVRRVDLVFGIGYGDNIAHAEKVLHDIIEKHELTLKKPEAMIKVHTLNESSVDFVVRPWVKSDDYWDVYWDITRQVKDRFDAEGISIPFPQRDVHVFQEGKSA